jgi:nicotinamidase-related amidase/MFS family permease
MSSVTEPEEPWENANRYQWVVLANTTAAQFMSQLDGSIVIIALPAIFRGIGLDPLSAGNIAYLLWMIMGYRLVQAVTVVNFGRLGDMFGRVRIYNLGFVVFTLSSILLSLCPFTGVRGAQWLIGWRVIQALGGSMLTANSAAILTDAFPREKRGYALGMNQVSGLSGMFIGLVAGGLLATVDWRLVFWVNVPVGIFGTLWAYLRLRDKPGARRGGRIDWWGNGTFALGLGAILVGLTYGIQPYGHDSMGWTSPFVVGLLVGGAVLLAVFILIETKIAQPLFQLSLFRIRAFTAGSLAGFAVCIARGGLQFMLIIWLQGIWLPLHGYAYSQTPLWAGIFLLPLTVGFLISGPLAGTLSDRFGARGMATGGMAVFAASFIGLMVLPIDFPYWAFAVLIAANGIGSGMFAAPNTSSIMSSVPAQYRGVASGMRSTFQNSGTAVSTGVFFSIMIAGLASTLPKALTSGLAHQGVSHSAAVHVGTLPPTSSLFAALLGVNPLQHALQASGFALSSLPVANRLILTGREFFPHLISGAFRHGLSEVFAFSAALAVLAGLASLLRGGRVEPIAREASRPSVPAAPQPITTPIGKRVTMPLTTIDTNAALIVIDLQKGVVETPTVHPVGQIVGRAATLAEAFRQHGLPVVLVKVTGRAPGRTDRSGSPGIIDSPDWTDLVGEIGPGPGDHLVTKQRRSAFHDTGLDAHLRGLGVTQVVLTGISTTSGVESTARSAYDHGYHVVLATDAMTDVDPDAHANSIERIFPKLGETATTAEILDMLAKTP